eukprot:TRINITY_DN4947_c0_g2_i2.p1 TRINITY_DN4947_c0_g2~~TRINITY_DN4947_c0_g2_i2.p1  ORF type:complete len:1874 (+),score=357.23 TRINITY_DN4947_c0_g2_i2:137-5623(+)
MLKWADWTESLGRRVMALTHVALGPPQRIGNHSPEFKLSADIVEVKEDSGPYKLGAQFAVDITDNNGDTQSIEFDCTNDNPDLFSKQPDIVACVKGFCVGTTEVPPATGTLIFTPRTDRFGTAIVRCRARDSGIEFPVCDNMPTPCVVVPCDVPNANCNESPNFQFTIKISDVNDQPEFVHLGDIVSPEDVEQCIENWAREVTAGGWQEDFGQMDNQLLYWNIVVDNPGLFKTQPYIRYTQGANTGDLCFTPADDMTGIATADIYLTDSGGRLDGGIDDKPPETITITIFEVNDPPTFTPGELHVVVEEDSGAHDLPWATDLSPGPIAEIRSKQLLDRFVIEFVNPAHEALFKVKPVISVDTGHLTFEVADDANTFGIDCAMTVHLIDTAAPPGLPAESEKPWPVLHIEITPVNDPPSYSPPQPQKDVTVLEGAGLQGYKWANNVCIGKAPPNCVESEGFPGGENQKIEFKLEVTNQELFRQLPTMDAEGYLSFLSAEDQHGASTVTVKQFDTGPVPNEGPTINFVIAVLQVNDQPDFVTPKTLIEVDEDSGPVELTRFLEEVTPGPPDEYSQLLSFKLLSVSDTTMFKRQPEVTFKSQRNGPTYGDLSFETMPNRFGIVNMTFAVKDDGGVENAVQWTAKVQKGSQTHTIGIEIEDLDITYVDPDSTAYASGIRAGMKIVSVHGRTVSNKATALDALSAAPDMGEFDMVVKNGTDIKYGPVITIHIKQVNDPPHFLKGDDIHVPEDNPPSRNSFPLWVHEAHPGDEESTIQYIAFNCSAEPQSALVNGVELNGQNGKLNFTLTKDFFGEITVEVKVADFEFGTHLQLSEWSAPQTFKIIVLPVNDPPIFEAKPLVTIPWCPPLAEDLTANCTREYHNFVTDTRPGPENELDQSLDFSIVATNINAVAWYNLFEGHHQPTITNTGSLTFILKRGAVPEAGFDIDIPIQIILKDDGGIDDGGLDTNTINSIAVFTSEATTVIDDTFPRNVIVNQKTAYTEGQTYVLSPSFRLTDTSGKATVAPSGTKVTITLNSIVSGVINTWEQAGGLNTYSANGTSIFTAGAYFYKCEVHLPDGRVLEVSDDTFVVSSGGRIDASAFREGGVVADRDLNEWDIREGNIKLVLKLVENTWLPTAATATVELIRQSTSQHRFVVSLQNSTTTTGTSGEQTNLSDASGQTGEQLSLLQSTATIDSPTQMTIDVQQQPVLNIVTNGELVVNLPLGSVNGNIAPEPVRFPLSAAPNIRIIAGDLNEREIQTAGTYFDLELTGSSWFQQSDFPYVESALSANVTAHNAFTALKSRLVTTTSLSPTTLRIQLGPLAQYDIDEVEQISVDPSKLRVTNGVKPDFDVNPSTLRVAPFIEVPVTPNPVAERNSEKWFNAAFVLSVLSTISAVAASPGICPLLFASPMSVAFALESCGTAQPCKEAWDGFRWWVRPKIVKIGGSGDPDPNNDDLYYAQGAAILVSCITAVLLLIFYGVVFAYRRSSSSPGSDTESKASAIYEMTAEEAAAKFRYPYIWIMMLFPAAQCVIHNCAYVLVHGSAETSWKVISLFIAIVCVAVCTAIIVRTVMTFRTFADYTPTSDWEMTKTQRLSLYSGIWQSKADQPDRISLTGGYYTEKEMKKPIEYFGMERKGCMLISYRLSRVWLSAAIFVWLLVLNFVSAHAALNAETDIKHLIVVGVLTLVFMAVVGFYKPFRSKLVFFLFLFALVLLLIASFVLATEVTGGTVAAYLVVCVFIILFIITIAVSYYTNKLKKLNHQQKPIIIESPSISRNQPLSPSFEPSPSREGNPILSEFPRDHSISTAVSESKPSEAISVVSSGSKTTKTL